MWNFATVPDLHQRPVPLRELRTVLPTCPTHHTYSPASHLPLTRPHPPSPTAQCHITFSLVSFRLGYSERATSRRWTAGSAILFVAPLRAPASLVEVLDETAEAVARDELLALELDARRGRGVVGLEPLLDGAALVGEAVSLKCNGEGR